MSYICLYKTPNYQYKLSIRVSLGIVAPSYRPVQELWQGVVPCCILLSKERWDFPATIALLKQATPLAYTVLVQQDTKASQPNGIQIEHKY